MSGSFRHKGLEEIYRTGKTRRIGAGHLGKCVRILQLLEVAGKPEDMNIAGFRFHGLQGSPKRWSVRVTGNYRITFAWSGESDPVIPGYAHRPAFRAALQAVKAKTRDVHVLRLPRYFQQLQDAHALPEMAGADPARLAGTVDLFKPPVPEATDHSFSVK